MKLTKTRAISLAAICSQMIAFSGCHHEQDLPTVHEEYAGFESETESQNFVQTTLPATLNEQSITIPEAPLEATNIAPVSSALSVVADVDDPNPYFHSVFDDNINVPPWRANYVGSYGVLPTRFQDKGPFLYSFDISPDADIFQDDDLGPIGLDHHDDDD